MPRFCMGLAPSPDRLVPPRGDFAPTPCVKRAARGDEEPLSVPSDSVPSFFRARDSDNRTQRLNFRLALSPLLLLLLSGLWLVAGGGEDMARGLRFVSVPVCTVSRAPVQQRLRSTRW